jgi:activating signal cointegrator complex subunit 3
MIDLQVRDEEMAELEMHLSEHCEVPVAGGPENSYGKTNILLQTYISRGNLENFSLVSDSAYVAQNSARIIRALFEMAVRKGWPIMAGRLLQMSKVVEKRQWGFESPLQQFPMLIMEILRKIEDKRLSVDRLRDMDPQEIGLWCKMLKS